MQLPHFRTTTRVTIAAILATVAVLFGRTGALPTAAANTLLTVATESATTQSDKKSKVQHFARVKSDGTLVNGKSVERSVLKTGDVLTVGRVEFRVLPG